MGFISPMGLLALLGMPLIILLYMLRPKNKPTIIASVYLWQSVLSELESASKIQKLRSSILMFLQLLVVLIMGLLLAGLYYITDVTTEHSIIIIDNTITMQSTDVSPSRFERAKTQAEQYIEQLPEGQRITLIEMKDVPIIHLNESDDPRVSMNIIADMKSTALIGDYKLLGEVVNVLLSQTNGEVVYFGDQAMVGATNYLVGTSMENVGIRQLSYSMFSEDSISVLADVYSSIPKTVQLSLYGDNILLDAISIDINETGVGKAFFDVVPNIFTVLKVTVDEPDVLLVDNESYLSILTLTDKKIALITDANVFLSKALSLYPKVAVYDVKMDDYIDINGFNMYIYDGIFPEKLPIDGVLVLFNPTDALGITNVGLVSNPTYLYYEHPLSTHLTEGDFAIGVSQVYELPIWANPVMTTDEGAIIFAGNYEGQDVVVIGFDIHNTDLPLTASFPIFMTNMIDYYLNQKQVAGDAFIVGDTVEINLKHNVVEGYIEKPNGESYSLESDVSQLRFDETDQVGVYHLKTLTSEGEQDEVFVVNGPIGETTKGFEMKSTSNSNTITGSDTMAWFFGIGILLILCIEWAIYGIRRGR